MTTISKRPLSPFIKSSFMLHHLRRARYRPLLIWRGQPHPFHSTASGTSHERKSTRRHGRRTHCLEMRAQPGDVALIIVQLPGQENGPYTRIVGGLNQEGKGEVTR